MKTSLKSLAIAAIAATAFFSCTEELQTPDETPNTVGAHFSFIAEVSDPVTKATLTPNEGETAFEAAWTSTDEVSLYAKSATFEETAVATWNATNRCFEGDFTSNVPTTAESWTYVAKYPYTTDGLIPFGSERVQNGNSYNSAYDVMYGTQTYDNALLGKNNNGGVFVIPMNRLTGIAYFHITGGPNEQVVSATLEAPGIAAANLSIASDGSSVSAVDGNTLDSITITFEENSAPTANDLQLWFNVLPGTYNSLTLTITTATKTATLNASSITYNAGKLNKAILNNLTWTEPVAGDPYTWVLASGDLGTTGSPSTSVEKGTPVLTWNNQYTWGNESTQYFGFENARGVQIGKGGDACTKLILSSNDYTEYIDIIKINFSHASSGGSSASVKVGSTIFTCDSESNPSGTTSATDYIFTADQLVKGTVEITISNSASKAIYLKSIEINPDPREEQTLSFQETSYNAELSQVTFASPTLTGVGVNTTVTYSSSNEEIATVDNNGLVTLIATGTTTITATAAENEYYKEGSASYTLNVTEGPSSIAAVVSADINSDVYTAGTVAQINTKGFIITDGNDNILVYQNATPSVSLGQYVKVVGTRTAYNNIPQIGGTITITQVATGQTVTRTELTTISSSNATGFTSCEYVSLSGLLSISGNFINISIDGSTTQGSIYNTTTSSEFNGISISSMAGERVIVTGYVTGSSNNYLNIAPVDIVIDDNYTSLEVSPSSLNWSAGEFGSDYAKTITVSLNGNASGYTVSGSSSDWTVSDNEAGTITVYPNQENNSTSDAKTLTLTITHNDNSNLTEDILCSQACSGEKINQVLFHESFGDNSGSARDWQDSYSVKSGVQAVYSGIVSYTVSNAKQGKNTTGSSSSGLNQSSTGTDAYIIIGPLNVAEAENMVLTYQWKAGSIKGTYSTHLYYATSSSGTYTEVTGTGTGATTFVERSYILPSTAQVSTLYLKITWGTSNTQAIIDEVNLQGDY